MAYSTINKPEDYFKTKLYTGNGSTNNITGVGFQPDFVWIKHRNNSTAYNHRAYDAVRGATKNLAPNATDAEITSSTELTSFDSDGFTLGSGDAANQNTINHASWNWLGANGTASNTDGSITSTVSANTTSGFSICTYTGNGTSGATFGHGLNSAPEMVIVKQRNSTGNWRVGHTGADSTFAQVLNLNLSNAKATANSIFNSTAPTSSVVTLGNESDVNGSSNTFVAYCFHSVKGYSKFGTYTGNGNADGPFVYTGFKPAFTIIKNSSSAYDWLMQDSTRQADANFDGNPINILQQANATNVESNASTRSVDYLSNGFKIRQNTAAWNTSGNTFIYMAFAERSLVGTNGVPALAR